MQVFFRNFLQKNKGYLQNCKYPYLISKVQSMCPPSHGKEIMDHPHIIDEMHQSRIVLRYLMPKYHAAFLGVFLCHGFA